MCGLVYMYSLAHVRSEFNLATFVNCQEKYQYLIDPLFSKF